MELAASRDETGSSRHRPRPASSVTQEVDLQLDVSNMLGRLGVILAFLASLTVLPFGKAATLEVSFAPVPPEAMIDLTAEGTEDWAHWGLDATNLFNHKAKMARQIS